MAKLKEIADDEEAVEEVEEEEEEIQDEVDDEEPEEVDVDEGEGEALVPEVVVPPGFRLWETDSKLLAKNGETLKVTKVSVLSSHTKCQANCSRSTNQLRITHAFLTSSIPSSSTWCQ